MYEMKNFGQTSEMVDTKNNDAETIRAVAELTRAITEPAAAVYTEKMRADINEQRIKAGLPPLLPANTVVTVPQEEDTITIGTIALLAVLFLIVSTT